LLYQDFGCLPVSGVVSNDLKTIDRRLNAMQIFLEQQFTSRTFIYKSLLGPNRQRKEKKNNTVA